VSALDPLFRPQGIAVVGASTDPSKLGAALSRSLAGFAGRVVAVNPRAGGMYPSVAAAAVDGPLDLAMICVPAKSVPEVLAESAAAGVRAAVICGGGFAEAGEEGAGLQAHVAAVAGETGVRVLGPNTSGFLAPELGLTASFVPAAAQVPAGRVAVVAASGGVNHAVAFLLAEAGHGVSLAVGLGNAVDVTAADVLDHLAHDPATGAIALHIESVGDGAQLVDAVRRCTALKPVVALVVGRNDVAAFAASHTGALATSWRVARAALAQAGAVLVSDERELVDAVGALSVTRLAPLAGPGVAVLTAQAGPGLLLLDDLTGRHVPVPELTAASRDLLGTLLPPLTYQRNPVDTGRPGAEFGAVVAAVAADPGVDLIAGYALDEPDAVDLVEAIGAVEVPMVFGVGGIGSSVRATRAGLLARGIAVADSPRGVAAATAALVADAQARHRHDHSPGGSRVVVGGLPQVWPGALDEDQAKTLLNGIGFATPPRRVCADRSDAERALADLGAPVAVKLLDATVLHKTEIGGVHLGVATQHDLHAALDALDAAGARRYLVEAMAPAGVDLILGARRDPVFGPLVLLGLGGTTAEVLADVVVRLAPLAAADAAGMPDELAAAALLEGWRGGPRLDRAALAEAVVALGDLLAQNSELLEIEINPLRVGPDGIVALDAVVRTAEVSDGQSDR
jgi:acetyltransferase